MTRTSEQSEAEFLEHYDPRAFPPTAVTVDVALFTIRQDRLCVLLVRRAEHPHKGRWALPGGFIGQDEDLQASAERKLAEKTGVERFAGHLEQLQTFGAPGRDPRMRVVSVAYVAIAPDVADPVSGTDSEAAEWRPVDPLPRGLAFDHRTILKSAIERVRNKLEYEPLAARFCGETFTIAELRRVYEIVWGRDLDARNFQRKVRESDIVEKTGGKAPAGRGGGPRADLYRAGSAKRIHPPMLRPDA